MDEPHALPPGTRFGELEILRTIGVGGFGIVYLAQDHSLERQIAIKEYMPAQLAHRGASEMVRVRAANVQETFELGLRSFVNEARLLARFDHRSLLKVYRFWEGNGTAYMAMPYLQGKTLKEIREALGEVPSEAWILKHLMPLIEGLTLLHNEQVYHRDIAPDNILLPNDGGDPILLDFGAARRAIGDKTQTFTAIFKPSYAPIEQYGETTQLRQGAWTDIYALGAVLHYLLTGAPPPLATTRAVIDEFVPLAQRDMPGFSRHFRAAIDWALSVRPSERPRTMNEFRDALLGDRTLPVVHPSSPAAPSPAPQTEPAAPVRTSPPPPFEATQLMPAPARVAQTVLETPRERGGDTVPDPVPRTVPQKPTPSAARPVAAAAERGQRTWMGLGLLAALLLLGAFWWVLQGRAKTESQEGQVVSLEPVAAASDLPETPASAISAVQAPVRTARAPASLPIPVAAASSPPRLQSAAASASVPAARPVGKRVDKPIEAAVETQPVTHAVVPAAAATGAQDPRAACGNRVFIALWRCIEQHCEEPGYAEHAECVNLKARRERREENRKR